jgi:aminoglycoside phosphotransferase family enzyme/predicted kinase
MTGRSGDQGDAIAFLGDPVAYGPGVARVETLSTHISQLFLAGERAYKLKRAVKYPYLDFSTAVLRRRACEAELALNRRTAPELYLGVRGIGRGADGTIDWSDADNAIDWVVVMRRFDQEALFDALTRRGALTAAIMLDLVAHIGAFHASETPLRVGGGAAAIDVIEAENNDTIRRTGLFAADRLAELHERSRARLGEIGKLLDERRAAGKVRHCHGDLHLRNICLIAGKPVLFDCLEFSPEMASIDVLYDLAFLLMDLEHRGLRDFANLCANRYLDLSDEDDGLAALPLFMAVRAAIRAKVTAEAATHDSADEARGYLDLALVLLAPAPVRLIALGGLSGTGKSTIAQRLAPKLGLRPGARVLRSDVIRKHLLGVAPETKLPAEAYTSEMSRRVYAALCDKAEVALKAGYCTIIDAVSLTADERASFAAVAAAAGVPFSGIWLDAPSETMASRIGARSGDASDATADTLVQQLRYDPGAIEWRRVDVGADRDASFAAVERVLGLGPADPDV